MNKVRTHKLSAKVAVRDMVRTERSDFHWIPIPFDGNMSSMLRQVRVQIRKQTIKVNSNESKVHFRDDVIAGYRHSPKWKDSCNFPAIFTTFPPQSSPVSSASSRVNRNSYEEYNFAHKASIFAKHDIVNWLGFATTNLCPLALNTNWSLTSGIWITNLELQNSFHWAFESGLQALFAIFTCCLFIKKHGECN